MSDLPAYKTPRWVKIFGISALVLVVLLVVALLVATALGLHTPGGPGGHGPGRDIPTPTPSSSLIEDDPDSGGDFAGWTSLTNDSEHWLQHL